MTQKILFVDFHSSFSLEWNYVRLSLEKSGFSLVIDPNPDFLFFGDFGRENGWKHLDPKYRNCIKIYWTEEPFEANTHMCDYALSPVRCKKPNVLHLPLHPRYLYHLREWTSKKLEERDVSVENIARIMESKTRFCNFVYSNPKAPERRKFFRLLSEYRKVDSAGAVDNNLNGWTVPRNSSPDMKLDEKLKFLAPYKFTIAFESCSLPGYTSEKIVEPMVVDSLPIYWGDPTIDQQFNPQSFVNAADYLSLEVLVEKIVRIDRDNSLWTKYLQEPWFECNVPCYCCRSDYLAKFFTMVFDDHNHRPH